jgi:hypothetical protein
MKPVVAYLLGAALLLSNAWWACSAFNAGMSLDAATSTLVSETRSVQVLGALLAAFPPRSGPEALVRWARTAHPDWIVKVEGSNIEIEGIRLKFRGDTLTVVESL